MDNEGEAAMFVTRIRPRVSETDGVGHINNTTIPVWLEAGREEIFRMFTPDLSFRNWRMIIVNMKIDFLKEMVLGQEVEVRTWVKKIGRTSLQLEEEIHQGGRLCVRGECTYVNYNLAERKAEPIPPHIRQQLLAHVREDTSENK